ncbi:hypothetical protein D8B23_14725 [Verminephrobacter aporrectodeae subsp. tuberculatae]|uniref:Secretion system X translation initiation factor n=1 Tax=Verminephrobacter aporrectodeae subsp. tuberculatae TaxID=1110392 RepID=A0ABT3KTI5_9BURK|nr:hypothetical protein [Verminephrobacter aporrectodeae]MCW5321110.1 hypothetical protein [Verminephrobacter aporrectodeae subsp. tuberculatae]MCW8199641.1 hypothetical protein [Verminephrobacter aporrectodeae subsp. tuberculatae]
MTRNAKRAALFAVLVATLVAAWFAPAGGEQDALLAPRVTAGAANRGAAPTESRDASRSRPAGRLASQSTEVLRILDRGSAEQDDGLKARLFDPAQWATAPAALEPAAQPVRAEASSVAPQVPPLPFQVLGRYEEDGRAAVFLQYMDKSLVVRVGDTIAEHYKVEGLSESTLTLRYLPLDQVQHLALGASQ